MSDKRRLLAAYITIILIIVSIASLFSSCNHHNPSLRQAIENQMKLYPASTLQDLYKSFFQDEYGPGHMAPDSAGAAEYLDYELEGMVSRHDYSAVPCGAGINFYRVPLDLVKDSIIPEGMYLSAFMISAKDFKTPDIEVWKAKWAAILSEIEAMKLQLPDFEQDKAAISEMLSQGETVVHHSPAFIQAYDPHYRIMKLEQWENLNSKFKIFELTLQ
jgi:hypothetical protein